MGKISKSKKTLALVMALVMAFTIVPFGAWGVIKASAASPEQTAGANFKPATELKNGQKYVIVNKDKTQMMADGGNGKPVVPIGWHDGITKEAVESAGGFWTYKCEKDIGRFQSKGGYWLDFSLNQTDDVDKKTIHGKVSTYSGMDCQFGITNKGGTDDNLYEIKRTNGGTGWILGYSNPDGQGHDNFNQEQDSKQQGVLIYELITEGPETIELPIQMLDFHADKILFNLIRKDQQVFNLSGNRTTALPTSDGTGVGNKSFSSANAVNQNLEDGLYSKETVEYTAAAIKELMTRSNRGWNAGVYPGVEGYYYYTDDSYAHHLKVTPLGSRLLDKFTKWEEPSIYERFKFAGTGSFGDYDSTVARFKAAEDAGKPLTYADVIGGSGTEDTVMDVAYFFLTHLFEEDTSTYDLSNYGNRENLSERYNMKAGANELQLEKMVDANGKVYYLYDSAFTSDYEGTIKNTGLDQHNVNSGTSQNSNAKFLPLDGKGFGTTVDSDKTGLEGKDQPNGHNYNFTMHGEGKFVYRHADELYFDFTGDDDVFLYINNKLAINLTGTHTNAHGRVDLNNMVSQLGLEEGGIYDFDFFYMERNSGGSNLRMETNIKVDPAPVVAQKLAYPDAACQGEEIKENTVMKEGDVLYYEIAMNNLDLRASGATTVKDVKLTDETLGITLSGNKNEIDIDPDITGVDLSQMKIRYAKVDANGVPLKNADGSYVEYYEYPAQTKEQIAAAMSNHGKHGNTVPAEYSLWAVGIKYTFTHDNAANGKFVNKMKATAKSFDGTKELSGTDDFTLKTLKIQNKNLVVDFVGGTAMKYNKNVLFNGADEKNFNTTIAPAASGSTLTVNDNDVIYTPAKGAINTDIFKVEILDGSNQFVDYKYIRFIPANNIYYDDSFKGIDYVGWNEAADAGSIFTGVSGTHEIYGNTTEETDFTTNSHYIVGSANGQMATASFTFTGEGFSLYMDTNADSGDIYVKTTKVGGTKPVTDYFKINSATDLKDVPVVNRVVLPEGHGIYTVQIAANIPTGKIASLKGIRVYNPLGNGDDGINYYTEQNAQFIEIRDTLVNAADFNAGLINNGSVFLHDQSDATTVADYESKGPKNEVYLKNTNAIAFAITDYNAQRGQSIQISARSADGNPVDLMVNNMKVATINSTLDEYYDITSYIQGDTVKISVGQGGILALTNLKLCNETGTKMSLYVNKDVVARAAAFAAAPVEPEVPETPTEPETPVVPQNPFEKFFNDIKDFFNKLFGIK